MAAAVCAVALVSNARSASAQLHWDIGGDVGLTKRFLTSRPLGGSDAGFGPSLGAMAHVALLPMVRIGGYVSADLSPAEGSSLRQFLAVGARVKILSPWPQSPFRAWIFAGFGYAGVYSHRFQRTLFIRPDPELPARPTDVSVEGAGGGFAEVPVGVGASYKLNKPWELFAELGARFGFGFTGSNYTGRAASDPVGVEANLTPIGNDSISLGLSVGIAAGM